MPVDFKDYYGTLGVSRTASADEIKKAYRKLARQHHPDRASDSGKAAAEEKIKEINEAYQVLKDPEKRARYDQLGANWDQQGPTAGGAWKGGAGPFARGFSSARGMDTGGFEFRFGGTGFSDFFERFFGAGSAADFGGSPFGTPGRHGRFSRAGEDVESDIMVTLEEAANGAVRQITLRRTDASGKNPETQKFKVKIPAGVHDGQRLRVAGQGKPGTGRGPAGDLYLRVRLAAHPDFRVQGADLIYDLELAPWEAVLGAKVDIPTLTGTVRLSIKPGTSARRRLRIPGRGLPRQKEGGSGDLFVIVSIAVPEQISAREKELWQELADKSTFRPRE